MMIFSPSHQLARIIADYTKKRLKNQWNRIKIAVILSATVQIMKVYIKVIYRRSPHFMISEFVIPAISWFGFRHYFPRHFGIPKTIFFWNFLGFFSYFCCFFLSLLHAWVLEIIFRNKIYWNTLTESYCLTMFKEFFFILSINYFLLLLYFRF